MNQSTVNATIAELEIIATDFAVESWRVLSMKACSDGNKRACEDIVAMVRTNEDTRQTELLERLLERCTDVNTQITLGVEKTCTMAASSESQFERDVNLMFRTLFPVLFIIGGLCVLIIIIRKLYARYGPVYSNVAQPIPQASSRGPIAYVKTPREVYEDAHPVRMVPPPPPRTVSPARRAAARARRGILP